MPHPNGHKSFFRGWSMTDGIRVLHVNYLHSTTEFPPSYFILKVTTFVQFLQFNMTQLLRFLILQAYPDPDSRNLQAVPYLRVLMPLVDEGIERSFCCLLISTPDAFRRAILFLEGEKPSPPSMQCQESPPLPRIWKLCLWMEQPVREQWFRPVWLPEWRVRMRFRAS